MDILYEYEKQLKILRKKHKKRLKKLRKNDFDEFINIVPSFIDLLIDMRDVYFILNLYQLKLKDKIAITFFDYATTIDEAIKEYEAYIHTISKYFAVSNTGELITLVDGTEDEVMEKCAKEQVKHWSKFCGIVSKNINHWTTNDAIQLF